MHWLIFERKWPIERNRAEKIWANWFHVRSLLFWLELLIVYALFLILYFSITNELANQITVSIVAGFHFIYASVVGVYFIYHFCYYHKYPVSLYGWVPILELVALYIAIMTKYQLLYLATALIFPDSFTGLAGFQSKGSQFVQSWYYTGVTLAAIGSDSIAPNNSSEAKLGFITTYIESIETWGGFLLFSGATLVKIQEYNKYYKKQLKARRNKRRTNKKNQDVHRASSTNIYTAL